MRKVLVVCWLFLTSLALSAPTALANPCQYGAIYFELAPDQEDVTVSGYYPYGEFTEQRCKTGTDTTLLEDEPGIRTTYVDTGVSSFRLIVQSPDLPEGLRCAVNVSVNGRSWVTGQTSPIPKSNPSDFWEVSTLDGNLTDTERRLFSSLLKLGNNSVVGIVNCPTYPVANRSVEISYGIVESADGEFPGISINDGAEFTNSRAVKVTVTYPRRNVFGSIQILREVALSNDGGFAPDSSNVVSYTTRRVPWVLRATTDEKLPRMVYARLRIHTGNPSSSGWLSLVLSDDIILDTVAPRLLSVSARASVTKSSVGRSSGAPDKRGAASVKMSLKARDNRSGVEMIQVSTRKASKGAVTTKYRSSVSVPIARGSKILYVRVQDGAGNWSKWTRTTVK